jgi:hypothetical protein
MLRRVTIVCPFCDAETEISVSTGDGKEMHGAKSPCRTCRQPILTIALADGQIAFLKDDQLFLLHTVAKTQEGTPLRGRGKRHQILPPQNLGLFDRGAPMEAPAGISDDELKSLSTVVQIDRLLWRPDGTRRAAREIAKHVGFRSAWVAELNYNLRLRLSQPPPFSEPPAVFLSYRWGGEQHGQWVAALADELAGRGYRVTLAAIFSR